MIKVAKLNEELVNEISSDNVSETRVVRSVFIFKIINSN